MVALVGLAAAAFAPVPVAAASANCAPGADSVLTGGGEVRVFAMQHKQDITEYATYQSIRDSLDCELVNRVDPYRAADHPNLVVYNELNGLAYGLEGTRGAAARAGANGDTFIDQLIGQSGAAGIGTVAWAYSPQVAYYTAKFGPPADATATVGRLFTAITDTMVRAVVENLSALARAHGVYIVFGAPMVTREGAACSGAYSGWRACPGWHRSTAATDIAALQDPDLAPAPYVYVADSDEVDNVELFFGPDGNLYDMQPKVNLTPIEISPLGWHQAGAATIHAIPLSGPDAARFPDIRMGVGISLDAFETRLGATACPVEPPPGRANEPYKQFMQCLDSKGVNLFLQPEFNDGTGVCASWTDFTEDCGTPQASWQPLSWMRSAWFAVQGGLFPHFRYAVNPFMVGNLFDITGDGQSAIFSRDDPRGTTGWYAGDGSDALYNGAGVGVFTDRPDDPRYRRFEGPQPGFLALSPWVITESSPAARYRCRPSNAARPDCSTVTGPPAGTPGALAAGDPGSLQSCEKGLAPRSGVSSGPCAENNYRSAVLVADLFPGPAVATPAGAGLPFTGRPDPWSGVGAALVAIALGALWGRPRRPPSASRALRRWPPRSPWRPR